MKNLVFVIVFLFSLQLAAQNENTDYLENISILESEIDKERNLVVKDIEARGAELYVLLEFEKGIRVNYYDQKMKIKASKDFTFRGLEYAQSIYFLNNNLYLKYSAGNYPKKRAQFMQKLDPSSLDPIGEPIALQDIKTKRYKFYERAQQYHKLSEDKSSILRYGLKEIFNEESNVIFCDIYDSELNKTASFELPVDLFPDIDLIDYMLLDSDDNVIAFVSTLIENDDSKYFRYYLIKVDSGGNVVYQTEIPLEKRRTPNIEITLDKGEILFADTYTPAPGVNARSGVFYGRYNALTGEQIAFNKTEIPDELFIRSRDPKLAKSNKEWMAENPYYSLNGHTDIGLRKLGGGRLALSKGYYKKTTFKHTNRSQTSGYSYNTYEHFYGLVYLWVFNSDGSVQFQDVFYRAQENGLGEYWRKASIFGVNGDTYIMFNDHEDNLNLGQGEAGRSINKQTNFSSVIRVSKEGEYSRKGLYPANSEDFRAHIKLAEQISEDQLVMPFKRGKEVMLKRITFR